MWNDYPVFRKISAIYTLLLAVVVALITSMVLVRTTISTRAHGVIRPLTERPELRAPVAGIVQEVNFRDGDMVTAGAIVLKLRDNNTGLHANTTTFEIKRTRDFIHDLERITSGDLNAVSETVLLSPVYRQQLSRFRFDQAAREAALKKAGGELELSRLLLKERVIARKEMNDLEIEYARLEAAYQAFKREQYSQWLQELARYRTELGSLLLQRMQIDTDRMNYSIVAPVDGIIQGMNHIYRGSVLQQGETVGVISPESTMIAECFVPPRDVGLLKRGQETRFQIDAFDYNYFGILKGKILSVEGDYNLVENQPMFKVRCSFDSSRLVLTNGFTGELKKGLTLQARFIVAERTLWQLLFDKLDDWLNPAAPGQIVPGTKHR